MNRSEIKALIDHYRSEQAKLTFQVNHIKGIVRELREQYKSAPEAPKPVVEVPAVASAEAAPAKPAARRGRPKSTAKKTTARKTTARKTTARKTAASKPAAKKTTATKTTAKKTTTRAKSATATKANAAKPAVKKTTARRGRPPKKVTAPKAGEPTGPGEPAAKLKKTAAKKTTTRKTTRKATATKAVAAAKMHEGTKAPSKRGRKKGSKATGYKLNEWDQALVDAIRTKGKVMINSEMVDVFDTLNQSMKLGLKEADLKNKLNRTLTKLANRRDILAKTSYSGKGFAYGLNEWLRNGKMMKKYQI